MENERIEFLRVRFEYCKDIYYNMAERREKLDNKTKLLLSFVVLLLSALILNISNTQKLKDIVYQTGHNPTIYIFQFCSLLVILIYFISVICVFLSLKVRSFDEIYPKNFSEKFLFKGSKYFLNEEEKIVNIENANMLSHFYYTMTKVIIHTIEINSKLLNDKAKWFNYSWQALLLSLIFLSINTVLIIIIK